MEKKFKKNMSTFSLLMTGITSIIGSGWLLATQKISNIAGPAGIFAWFIGMFVAIIIALLCIEVGTANPSAGGIGSYSKVTHGGFSGFITQWINWLSILAVPAVETQAIIRYLSESSDFCKSWYDVPNHILTSSGIFMAVCLMLFFMVINYFGLKLFARINNFVTIIKIAIPILTIICLLISGFYPQNFGSDISQFMPYGIKSIGTAVISCGVIMSFNGFQLPLNFSEEIENPKRQLPIAIIGSILFTFVLYVVLQIVFIGKVEPNKLIGGWHGVNYRSPYVDLLLLANLHIMSLLVMSTSAIAPAACGSAFLASSSRMLFNLARFNQLPRFLGVLDETTSSPRAAIITNTILGSVFLFIFKGWGQLVAVISLFHVFSYISTPIVAVSFRKYIANNPEVAENNQFKVPFIETFALIIMFVLSFLMFLSGWSKIQYIIYLLVPGCIFYFYYEIKNNNQNIFKTLKGGFWILYFVIGISLIGFLGNSDNTVISMQTSVILLVIFTITCYIWGIKSTVTIKKI